MPSGIKFKTNNRQFLSGAIILFYLIPLLCFAAYSIGLMPLNKSWSILSLGLLLIAAGSLILILLMYYWEKSLKESALEKPFASSHQLIFYPSEEKETKVTSLDSSAAFARSPSHCDSDLPKESTKELNLLQMALEESQGQHKQLQNELQLKSQEFNQLKEENKHFVTKAQQVAQDFADYKLFSEEQLKQKNLQMAALQQMIEDQRAEMEKRQDQIYQLDTKVHDLSYEIKTLLYLHEEEASSKPVQKGEGSLKATITGPFSEQADAQPNPTFPDIDEDGLIKDKFIKTQLEAVVILKKCINIAQKLTGANYHSNEASRYREFSSSHYTIDQRRLFDSLRNEVTSLIILYSQKENKVLFVNNQSKSLLGWSPEKFILDFSQIFQEGSIDWRRALNALSTSAESQARLLAKTKYGQEILLNCHLGIIPAGLFRNFVIGVLYPA